MKQFYIKNFLTENPLPSSPAATHTISPQNFISSSSVFFEFSTLVAADSIDLSFCVLNEIVKTNQSFAQFASFPSKIGKLFFLKAKIYQSFSQPTKHRKKSSK